MAGESILCAAIADNVLKRISQLATTNVIDDVCKGKTHGVEENVKIGIVIPILECLGYANPADFDFEYSVGPKSADIALLVEGKPVVIVECKSIEIDLEKVKSQGLEYACKKGIDWTCLTNGLRFQLFKSFISGIPYEKNEPVFQTTLRNLPVLFPKLLQLMGKEQVKDMEKKVEERINFIRKKITEEEFLAEVQAFKREVFFHLKKAFENKYEKESDFAARVDKWLEANDVSKEWSWTQQFSEDIDFSNYVVDKLNQTGLVVSKSLLLGKYEKDKAFANKIDSALREKDLPVNWIDRLCGQGAYAFINRLLFMRMYEDRILRKERGSLSEDFLPILEKASDSATIAKILSVMFSTMESEFPGMYTSPIFDGVFMAEIDWSPSLIRNIVEKTKKHDFSSVDRDILGEVYQRHVPKNVRKALGQFYTSPSIVRYVFSRISESISSESTILDPACGSGTFLTQAYEEIVSRRKRYKIWSPSDHMSILKNCIWGIDIDSFATQLTVMNLLIKDLNYPCDIPNVVTGNSLADNLSRWISGTSERKKLSGEVARGKSVDDVLRFGTKTGFNIVVGNPPHRIIKKKHPVYGIAVQNDFLDIIQDRVNIAALFVKRSLSLLRQEGVFAMILPKPFAWNNSYKKLRLYISSKYKVLEITDLGKAWDEVGQEQIILFAQKIKDKQDLSNNEVRVVSGIANVELLEYGEFKEHTVKQKEFFNWPAFPMYLNNPEYPRMESIWKKVFTNSTPLTEIAAIFRGYAAQSWPEISKKKESGYAGVLRGEFIGKSGITERWGIEFSKIGDFINPECPKLKATTKWKGQVIDKKDVVLNRDKIVAKRLVSSDVKIDAAMCPSNMQLLDFDTITNVVLMDDAYVNWYVLGILNSNLARVFMRDLVFVRSTLTMDLDEPYLGQLPIKRAEESDQQAIAEKVKELSKIVSGIFETDVSIETSHDLIISHRKMKQLNDEINQEIDNLYGLSKKEHEALRSLAEMKFYGHA